MVSWAVIMVSLRVIDGLRLEGRNEPVVTLPIVSKCNAVAHDAGRRNRQR